MTTPLAPAIGHSPLFTQAGVGASPGYDFIDIRRAYGGPLQEGVMGPGSFAVTQRSSGANPSVDIAASTADAATGVAAYVQGDSITAQGLYAVPPHTSVINESITSNATGNPRVDIVVLEVRDDTHDSSGGNDARVRVISGTASSGATLSNRTGAASLPGGCLLLADVLVASGASSITNANIRDRRKWARGAYGRVRRTSNASAGINYGSTATSYTLVDATNLQPRVECSGAPIIVTLHGVASASGAAYITIGVDGVAQTEELPTVAAGGAPLPLAFAWEITPAAGSHLVGPMWKTNGLGSMELWANSSTPATLTIQEVVREQTFNNATSG